MGSLWRRQCLGCFVPLLLSVDAALRLPHVVEQPKAISTEHHPGQSPALRSAPMPHVALGLKESAREETKKEQYYLFLTIWWMTKGLQDKVSEEMGASCNETGWLHHSENTWCKVHDFTPAQQRLLDAMIDEAGSGYMKLSNESWQKMHGIRCEVLGYEGAEKVRAPARAILRGDPNPLEARPKHPPSNKSCSGVYDTWTTIDADHRDEHTVLRGKYIYGRTTISRDEAHDRICECGEEWAETSYNAATRNCNTFAASVRGCELGLSADDPLFVDDGGNIVCCDTSEKKVSDFYAI